MKNFAHNFLRILDSQPRSARGQSLVEMAFTMPLMFMMVISIAEVGFLANNYLILLDALREGGRYAAVNAQPPVSWASNPRDASGDQQTRNWHRTDCETTKGGSVSTFHINNPAYDIAQGINPPGHPAVAGYGVVNPSTGPAEYDFGFFDGTACQVVAALEPLRFDYERDDIVVSVIGYVNLCSGGGCVDAATGLYGGTRELKVSQRFPLSNRKCTTGAGTNNDGRDPFLVTEIPGTSLEIPVPGASNNDVRGFILSGHQKASTDNSGTCLGSKFFVGGKDNINDFNLEYRLNTLPNTEINRNTPNGGMVIVEMTWTHNLLFNLPPFSLMSSTGNGKFSLHTWMIFPVNSAEPTATG